MGFELENVFTSFSFTSISFHFSTSEKKEQITMQNTVVIYTGLNSKKQKPQQNKHLFREYYTSSEKTKPLCSVFFFIRLVLFLICFMWSYQMHSQNIHTSNGIKCTKIINKNFFRRILIFFQNCNCLLDFIKNLIVVAFFSLSPCFKWGTDGVAHLFCTYLVIVKK